MKKVIGKTVYCLQKHLAIPAEYEKMLAFAVEQLLWDCCTFAAAFLMTFLFFREPIEILIFAGAFTSLRRAAGGIHAQTRTACMGCTIMMFLAAFWLGQRLSIHIIAFLFCIAAMGIYRIGPIENADNRLTISETLRNRKKTGTLLPLYTGITLCLLPAFTSGAKALMLAVVMVFVLQLLYLLSQVQKSEWKLRCSSAVLAVCIIICTSTVNSASHRWQYQAIIPEDIRKFADRHRL